MMDQSQRNKADVELEIATSENPSRRPGQRSWNRNEPDSLLLVQAYAEVEKSKERMFINVCVYLLLTSF